MTDEKFLYQHTIKEDTDFNIWTTFPGIYNFGMSSLGYMSIFKTLDLQDNYFVERIFADTDPHNTQLSTKEVDVMSFSMSFEIDFLTIFKIMEKFNIPLKSKDRTEEHPIIFVGGPVVTANPEPFCEFFDVVMIGDGENIVDLMTKVEQLQVQPDTIAKVVIDESSGIVVIGKDVKINRLAIAQGNLTIKITDIPFVAQPEPFTLGEQIVVNTSLVDIEEDTEAKMQVLDTGINLQELVDGLNALGVTPRDLISILQAIKASGALQAEIEVI